MRPAGGRWHWLGSWLPSRIYFVALHDALPISWSSRAVASSIRPRRSTQCATLRSPAGATSRTALIFAAGRSEEHTSELQSHHDLVCRLLLEKKKITLLLTERCCRQLAFCHPRV